MGRSTRCRPYGPVNPMPALWAGQPDAGPMGRSTPAPDLSMIDSTPFKCILFEKRVRFRLPADWLEGVEAGIGVFQPPQEGGGTLRVTSYVLRHGGPPGDGDLAAATRVILRQTVENFVRPDDPRVEDRIIDELDDGSLIA